MDVVSVESMPQNDTVEGALVVWVVMSPFDWLVRPMPFGILNP